MDYESLLTKVALNDERIVVMTAENRALVRELPGTLGHRFIDTGITEQCMVGVSAGLALCGRVPIVHALGAFLTMRAFEFIRTDVGLPNLPVKLSSFVPGLLSDGNGPTHQAIEDISLMRGIPNMQVFAPADEDDLIKALPTIWGTDSPAYVRLNTRQSAYEHEAFTIGKAEVVSTGCDVNILVYGLLFEQALVAKAALEEQGLSVGLLNLRSLKPIDEEAVLESINDARLTVTLEDHFETGGLFSIVSELMMRRQQTARVMPIALPQRWYRPALLPDVLEYEGLSGGKIAQRITTELGQKD